MKSKFIYIALASSVFLLMQAISKAEDSSLREQIETLYNAQKQALFKEERSLYETQRPKNELFYIYVFRQVIPIPNRFVLLSQETNIHQFNSMPLLSDISIGGVIKAGDFSSIKDELKEKSDHIKDDYIDSRTGLNVKIYEHSIKSPNPNKNKLMEEVIISNGDQFLSIFDDNPELWKLILSSLEGK